MSTTELGRKGPGDRMPVANWEVDTLSARNALTEAAPGKVITISDIGRVCRVGTAAPYAYYILEGIGPLVWSADLVAGGGGGGGVTAHSALTGLTAGNDHTQYQLRSEKDQASGYAGLTAGKLAGIQVPYGVIASSACEGNDTRLWPTSTVSDSAKLAALPDNATLVAGYAVKRAEKGFVTSRAITASDVAVNGDSGNVVDANAAAGINFTINNGVGAANDLITIYVISTGAVTLVAGANVSIVAPPGKTLVSTAAGSVIQLRKRVTGATDIWHATGHLV